jgi:hypothetical protein
MATSHHGEIDQALVELQERLIAALKDEEGALELTADQVRAGGIVALIQRHLAPTS